jgi:hypothetical protein
VCAVLVGLLYASALPLDAARGGLDQPIWIDHPEGLIHTNTGKWLVAPPHRYMVEGGSGEFPQYYPSLSDTLLNVAAFALAAPPMSVQAVLMGPLLGAAFLLFNYLTLAALLRDEGAALAASLVLSLGGNSSFVSRIDPASGLPIDAVLHVPFHVISLATSQSLGWVLLLPTLGLAYLAHRSDSVPRALGAGALLGVLFHSHTLSFVNAGAAGIAWLVAANALERPRDARFKVWLGALAVVAAAFVAIVVTRPSVSFGTLAALGALALAATFWIDPRKRFYLCCYGTAAAVAAPYVVLLAQNRVALARMQDGWASVQMMAVSPSTVLLYFAAYLVAAAAGWRGARDRQLASWALALLAATGFLAVNHLWHWGNHPYRYAIHLLFPLTILGAAGLRRAPRALQLALAAWLVAICAYDAWGFATGRARVVRVRVAEEERARFLRSVRDVTGREAGSGKRLLPPVELTYPRGLVQAALLMNYSRIPAFIPDYRHVLWPERHHNRMGLYCFLFPGYPNQDYPFGWRACDEPLDPDPALLAIKDVRLKTGILPVYGIAFGAAPGKPFSNHLKEASPRYGWPMVLSTDNAALVRTDVPALPGVARLAAGAAPAARLSILVEPERPGPHVVVLGGRFLDRRLSAVHLDGRPVEPIARRGNWAVLEAELAAGRHALELPSLAEGPDPAADYLYFAAVVSRELAPSYLELGAGRAPERR